MYFLISDGTLSHTDFGLVLRQPVLVVNDRKALKLMAENLGTPFLLLTQNNVTDFQLPNHPFHPAVNYTLEIGQGLI